MLSRRSLFCCFEQHERFFNTLFCIHSQLLAHAHIWVYHPSCVLYDACFQLLRNFMLLKLYGNILSVVTLSTDAVAVTIKILLLIQKLGSLCVSHEVDMLQLFSLYCLQMKGRPVCRILKEKWMKSSTHKHASHYFLSPCSEYIPNCCLFLLLLR